MDAVKGYRTYIVAGLLAIVAAAQSLGYVDDHTAETFRNWLAGFGLFTLRAAVK